MTSMEQLLSSPPVDHAAPWTVQGRNTVPGIFRGAWAERDWRNVPGAFYATVTDTCGGGMWAAPDLVLVNEDWTEFVFRQPTSDPAVLRLIDAAYDDPFQAYACDGDDRWTVDTVREWWADRPRLLEWIASARATMVAEDAAGVVAGLDAYEADIRGPLEGRLREYLFWLDAREAPQTSSLLPTL